jgi:TPR repeat protein
MFSNGEGVRRDDKEASSWYRKAAEQGNARAQFNLAKNYETGAGFVHDKGEALKWYVRAAEQNDEDAQLEAARLYGDQASSRYDPAKARTWYGRAALNGKAEAQLALGVIYSKGRGVAIDSMRASMWFKLASGYLSEGVAINNGSVGDEAGQLLRATEQVLSKQQIDTVNAMTVRCSEEKNIELALTACGLN